MRRLRRHARQQPHGSARPPSPCAPPRSPATCAAPAASERCGLVPAGLWWGVARAGELHAYFSHVVEARSHAVPPGNATPRWPTAPARQADRRPTNFPHMMYPRRLPPTRRRWQRLATGPGPPAAELSVPGGIQDIHRHIRCFASPSAVRSVHVPLILVSQLVTWHALLTHSELD